MSLFARFLALLVVLCVSAGAIAAAPSSTGKGGITIKKCQDADGKWHYGDNAADECAKSKIDVLNKGGVKKQEIAAPPTAEELAERGRKKEEEERQAQLAEQQKRRDQILLQSYPTEDDLLQYRDRKISQLELTTRSSQETLSSLNKVLERLESQKQSEEAAGDKAALAQTNKSITQTRAQIKRHEGVIAKTHAEQDKLRAQFDADLTRYRELKRQQPASAAKTNEPSTAQ